MNKWDKLEQAVIAIFNIMDWELTWVGDENLCYDAIGKTISGKPCVLEIKFRTKYYKTKMLEKQKYDCLKQQEAIQLYFVADPKGNYLYWLNDLILPEIQTHNLPKTTMWSKGRTEKEVYLLSESQAIKINYNI